MVVTTSLSNFDVIFTKEEYYNVGLARFTSCMASGGTVRAVISAEVQCSKTLRAYCRCRFPKSADN